ncbi:MAG: type II toxin-antitoxin system HicB family antitoxin [Ruminococcus sp.]|nr:type II toxin-antitoxin system HicB family antitoxin [Ruminococcus sp.]MCM1382589.1 type II toxin-antitoxin system HicB family antitoxin [Muribaculaceae bacterium]MCM1480293.1 type II toxin-antitoxin system HicB family antitoxin [Muribaculaceae bacterium]
MKDTKLTYPACFYPDEGGYVVIVPDLPGCMTQGDTLEEAVEMAIDAASGWVLDELEDGKKPPKASELSAVNPDEYPNGFVSLLFLDMDSYAEKYGSKAVRKNCTIPAWLNTAAEQANINFSAVLQSALKERLNIE